MGPKHITPNFFLSSFAWHFNCNLWIRKYNFNQFCRAIKGTMLLVYVVCPRWALCSTVLLSSWETEKLLTDLEVLLCLIPQLCDSISLCASTPSTSPRPVPNSFFFLVFKNHFLHDVQDALLIIYLPNPVIRVLPSVIKITVIEHSFSRMSRSCWHWHYNHFCFHYLNS